MSLTSDRNDPRIGYGVDETPVDQAEAYLVLSEEELAKGFVRPYRDTYVHAVEGCGSRTTMKHPIAETYATRPNFYGATYCVRCQRHRPVDEFLWIEKDDTVGEKVGS